MLRFKCLHCNTILRVSNSKNNKKIYKIEKNDQAKIVYTGICKRCTN